MQLHLSVHKMQCGPPCHQLLLTFIMEEFEHQAMQSAPYKPSCFRRYEDTFLILPHQINYGIRLGGMSAFLVYIGLQKEWWDPGEEGLSETHTHPFIFKQQ